MQKMVDKKELPVNTAADISYLKKEEQKALAEAIQKEAKVPSGTQAAELKKASQAGTLTQEQINKTVAPTKRDENPPLKVTFSDDELRAYFPEKGVTVPDVKRAWICANEFWNAKKLKSSRIKIRLQKIR